MISALKNRIGFHPLRWRSNTRRMKQLVGELLESASNEQRTDRHYGIVITPWLGTSVPWFTLAIGLLLANRGNKVTFLLDDHRFGSNPWRFRFVLGCLRSVLNSVSAKHNVITVSKAATDKPATEDIRADAKRLARLNTVWELRGEMPENGRVEFAALCESQLLAAYPSISSIVKAHAFDLLFIPGGVWGTSGIWTKCAQAADIRIGSFDSGGYGTVMLAVNGIACQLQDIPAAFKLIKGSRNAAASIAFATQEARAEMARRQAGVDSFMSQVKDSNGGDSRYDGAILLALNSSWDSAALGLHTVFKDNTDWIVSTVRHLLDETDVPIIVRQHPAERLEIARTSDDYRKLLNTNFGEHPRLHFIAAADKINSYELMERVSALIVYTSTIGIEAAAKGKTVITPSNSYYSRLGFVHRAETIKEYKLQLSEAANTQSQATTEQKTDALLCYYLTQCCNWVFCDLNPADFDKWSSQSLSLWSQDSNVRNMIDSLETNTPIAYINHLERLNNP